MSCRGGQELPRRKGRYKRGAGGRSLGVSHSPPPGTASLGAAAAGLAKSHVSSSEMATWANQTTLPQLSNACWQPRYSSPRFSCSKDDFCVKLVCSHMVKKKNTKPPQKPRTRGLAWTAYCCTPTPLPAVSCSLVKTGTLKHFVVFPQGFRLG